jgi:hypothetical protein
MVTLIVLLLVGALIIHADVPPEGDWDCTLGVDSIKTCTHFVTEHRGDR